MMVVSKGKYEHERFSLDSATLEEPAACDASPRAIIVVGIIAANGMAYMQARAMTHFTDAAHRTLSPEALSRFQKIKVMVTGVRIPRPENLTTPADADLPYQTFRFGGPTHEDCEAWYIPGPAKTLVIAFPGYAASKSSLLGQAGVIHDMGYGVMLVDFRGAGGSQGDQTTVGFTEAEDVAAATEFAARQFPANRRSFTANRWAAQPSSAPSPNFTSRPRASSWNRCTIGSSPPSTTASTPWVCRAFRSPAC